MKPEVLHTLIVARILFDQAGDLSIGEEKHASSAALVILQDAVELVLYASLTEIGVDENVAIEKMEFDALVAELKKSGVKVPKTGTLKALNKARVIVKHYGQLSEPSTVNNYLSAARLAADAILEQVSGLNLQGLLLHELIPEGETKEYIKIASDKLLAGSYFEAMRHLRMALFIEIESEYVIEEWQDEAHTANPFASLGRSGQKAPYYTKNKKWIEDNVNDPFEYIQLDHEKIRIDLMEWGIRTQDFWNLWRLTPSVYRFKNSNKWLVKFEEKLLTPKKQDVEYCLDKAVSIITRKRNHFSSAKFYTEFTGQLFNTKVSSGSNIYEKADSGSKVVMTTKEDTDFMIHEWLDGFDGETYLQVFHFEKGGPFIRGYARKADCKLNEG